MNSLPIIPASKRRGDSDKLSRLGDIFAALSLLCCVSPCVLALLYVIGIPIFANLTGLQWLKIEAGAVVMAIVSAVLCSKLWRVALPISVLMFLFTNYVMGT